MREILEAIFGSLLALALLIGGIFGSLAAGGNGWPLIPSYLGAAAALFVAVRLPMGDSNMIESTVEGQKNIPAYFIPFAYPALFYAVGWILALLGRLFG